MSRSHNSVILAACSVKLCVFIGRKRNRIIDLNWIICIYLAFCCVDFNPVTHTISEFTKSGSCTVCLKVCADWCVPH